MTQRFQSMAGAAVAGAVAMAATSETIFYKGTFGKRDVANDVNMTLDSIFRVASLVKPITSVAAMQLVEEGALALDDPVSMYIPQFAELQVLERFDEISGEPQLRPPVTPVTVRHLLTHTSGFGYEFFNPLLRDAVAAGFFPSVGAGGDDFLQAPLVFDPGSRWHYGISTDWLGRLIETVRGRSLDEVFKDEIFTPLRMEDTRYNLPAQKEPRLVTWHARQQDGALVEAAREPPVPVTFFGGGGGLFSTAPDYIRFMRAMLRGGELDGARILNAGTVALMGENHIGDLEAGTIHSVNPEVSNDFDFFPGSVNHFGIGFLLNGQPVEGGRSAGSLTWCGVYNTYFWIDPEQDVCGVLLTQILPLFDPKVIKLLDGFEREVYSQVPAVR